MNENDIATGLESIGDGNSQYLTFSLGKEEFGLEILRVQEIKGHSKLTPIPYTPKHIKGMLNLRGNVVPVVDLRKKFELPEIEYTETSVIIVVMVRKRVVGLLVDAVSDVLIVGEDDRCERPDLGASVDMSFIAGMARNGENLISLLDIDKLISAEIEMPTTAA